ncbi:NUDIX hydrolase [Chitinimonas sp.]|uniref:NUDIX hydrolase n=1 Tax=Chitinimonas sp. TaxID=1934313 RepID=UPI0035B0AA91
MSDRIWKPNCTVAALVEHQGRFLLVEEETTDGRRYNQPAGHLDHGESLQAACVRETVEETGFAVEVTELLGIYQWSPTQHADLTFLRFAYIARLHDTATAGLTVVNQTHAPEFADADRIARLDQGIIRAVWLSYDEVLACRDRHRSPLVLQCIDDYRAGRRYPLELIQHHD